MQIHTLLPSPAGSNHNSIPLPVHGSVTNATTDTLDSFSLFVLSLRLVAQTGHHQRMTTSNVAGTGALDYNFCLTHESIETSLNAILASLMSSSSSSSPPSSSPALGNELRVLALLVTLGARIALYKAAIVNAQKAEFLAPVVGECQRMGVMTANTMSDILLQAEALSQSQVRLFFFFFLLFKPGPSPPPFSRGELICRDQIHVYRAMSLFIMPPLATAAEVQLCALKQSAKEIGQHMFYTSREIRHSLETVCAAMNAFKEMSEQYDALIVESQNFLDSTQLGKRPNSDFTPKPSSQRRRTITQTESSGGESCIFAV
jgi:hypothetical protein